MDNKTAYEEYPQINLKVTQVKFGPDKVINKNLRIDVFDEKPKIYIADKKNLYKDVYIDKSCASKKCKDGEVWRCVKTGFPGFYRWICIITSNKKLNIWRSIYGKSCRLPWRITFSLESAFDINVVHGINIEKEMVEMLANSVKAGKVNIDDLKTPIDNEHY